ncbi:hypothetical protein ASPVEDRAFT_596129 [Aspergillus versicolor CBS 583.65]|uniref:LysM domain-containing protein n=1 Tax=Aspergillus versicolor CBS 583.65 TaxID=1036611 RepID=A0A1L9PHL9_ASPVE|nr:uncharacterized protein ASPVEDRAFT_596129 [Aspergillus versicolor CBS 583.65]OJJ00945.1 hypothetical protein ASPVEDRAFT_596129 [Aspergillus versicolor CBS 583.65]
MIICTMLRNYLVLLLLFTCGFATTIHDRADSKDPPPSETSPSLATRPGTAKNCVRWFPAKRGDTCDKIVHLFNISLSDFFKWNPGLGEDCEKNLWADYSYCVGVGKPPNPPAPPTTSTETTETTTKETTTTNTESTITGSATTSTTSASSGSSTSGASRPSSPLIPSGSPTPSSSNPLTPTGSYSIANPITTYTPPPPTSRNDTWPPTHTQPGQPERCNRWHRVSVGDTCDTIQARYAVWVSPEQLLEWNPGLAEDCAFPFVGYWVCVGQPLNTTFTYYPSDIGTTTMPEPTNHTSTVFPTNTTTWMPSPTQGGLAQNCQNYYQANKTDTCATIIDRFYYLTENELHDWNPGLKDDCSGLSAGFYYCVAAFPSGQEPMPPTVTTVPSPTSTGTVKECAAWYRAREQDTCIYISLKFGTFSTKEFINWNPSVHEDCSLLQTDQWYCVAIPDTPKTRTEPFPTAMPTLFPRQPNIIKSCTWFWPVLNGDTCASIIKKNGITLAQFMAWNPDLVDKSGVCRNIIPNYEVCVEAPKSSSENDTPSSSSLGFETVTTRPSTEPSSSTGTKSSSTVKTTMNPSKSPVSTTLQ